MKIDILRDRAGTFEPQIVRKRQRRLGGVDGIVLSLYAKGLTAAEISAHFEEIHGASVSEETVSRITDKVIEEMQDWSHRPLNEIYAAIAVTSAEETDIHGWLSLWAGTGGEGAKFWMSVLTDIRYRGVKDMFFLVCDGLKGLPEAAGNTVTETVPFQSTLSRQGRWSGDAPELHGFPGWPATFCRLPESCETGEARVCPGHLEAETGSDSPK